MSDALNVTGFNDPFIPRPERSSVPNRGMRFVGTRVPSEHELAEMLSPNLGPTYQDQTLAYKKSEDTAEEALIAHPKWATPKQ